MNQLRLPTVQHTGGLRMTLHRVYSFASVRWRYQVMSIQTSALGKRRSGPRALRDCTSHKWRGWTESFLAGGACCGRRCR